MARKMTVDEAKFILETIRVSCSRTEREAVDIALDIMDKYSEEVSENE